MNTNLQPISRSFGFDIGTPIDRIYIEDFLSKNSHCIKKNIIEIADNTYSKKYAQENSNFHILHTMKINDNVIVGDLTKIESLPKNMFDCFICTQTLNFIYDFHKAIEGSYYLLKNGGVMLATVSGISQISRYDMDKWGDFWRFTDLSIKIAFEKIFGKENIEVEYYGNVYSAKCFLDGIPAEKLTLDELFYKDQDYQITIVVKAVKNV